MPPPKLPLSLIAAISSNRRKRIGCDRISTFEVEIPVRNQYAYGGFEDIAAINDSGSFGGGIDVGHHDRDAKPHW